MFFKSIMGLVSIVALTAMGVFYKEHLPFVSTPKQIEAPSKKTEIVTPGTTPAVITPVNYSPTPLKNVTKFAYYTSQVTVENINKTSNQLIIINEADKNSVLFNAKQINQMKLGNKLVLADISFTTAEVYRWYFKKEWLTSSPAFLGEKLSESRYVVKDWLSTDWWEITKSILDLTIDAGYNGIVIDNVATYADLGGAKSLRDKMIDYVIAISAYAKSKNKDFIILAKNGELLGSVPQYTAAIDGIVKEDLIYNSFSNGVAGPKNNDDQIVKGIRDLNEFKKAGLSVFVIEYVSGKQWEDAKSRLKANKLVGYSAPSRSPSYIRDDVW